MRRRIAASVVLVMLALVLGSGPAGAQTTRETEVGVVSGPVSPGGFAPDCNNVVVEFDEATSFVLTRTGDTDDVLSVGYELTGSAVAGEHYEALPGAVDFGAGESSATVEVEVLTGDRTDMVELTLSVIDGDGYQPDEAASATISFVRPRDPSLPPSECGFFFEGGDRVERSVEVGATPERLVVEQLVPPIVIEVPPDEFSMRVTGGALPPGLTLGEDGRFAGTATEAGAYEATVEACRRALPGTCATVTLVIDVVSSSTTSPTTTTPPSTDDSNSKPSTRSTLPETGTPASNTGGLGLLLVGVGFGLVVVASLAQRRRARAGCDNA